MATQDTKTKSDLTTGSIKKHLARTAIPMGFGLLAIISFQLIDTYFVAQLGTQQLTAISFTFPITYLIFSLMMGIGTGVTSVLSRQIGQKDLKSVRTIATQTLVTSLILSIIISTLGIQTTNYLFTKLGASTEQLIYIRQYMDLWYIGLIFITLPLIGNAIIRSTGDSTLPGIIMICAAVTNLILDPILIFGLLGAPAMGIEGAAMATIIANCVALLAGLYVQIFKKDLLKLSSLIDWAHYSRTIKAVMHVGIPAALSNTIAPLSSAIILAIISHHSDTAVAAFGITARIEALLFIPMMALAVGLSPVVGQNAGAKNFDRVHFATNCAIKICMIWSFIAAVFLFIFGEIIAAQFTEDTDIIKIAALYMSIIPITYGLANSTNIWSSTYNAMGMPKRAFIMNFTKMILVYIPFAYIGGQTASINGVIIAIALAYIITGISFHLWNRAHHQKIEKEGLDISLPL